VQKHWIGVTFDGAKQVLVAVDNVRFLQEL
jgi:hypothetical protein